MYELTLVELALFAGLLLLEKVRPARSFPLHKAWFVHWCALTLFSAIWLIGLTIAWLKIPPVWQFLTDMATWTAALLMYAYYSFVAYWYHRIRHSNRVLWHYVHYMHHAPTHMDVRVTFWRHPLEMLLDSLVVLIIGKLLGASVGAFLGVLLMESILEMFHHSNLHTPKWLRCLGYVIQLPEQHLVHHQKGLHRWNYGAITLWDSLFGTVRIPDEWRAQLGLPEAAKTRKLLLFEYK